MSEADIRRRPELHIESMDCEYFSDVGTWYTSVERSVKEAAGIQTSAPAPAADAPADAAADAETPAEGEDAAAVAEEGDLAEVDVEAAEEMQAGALEDLGADGEEGEAAPPSGEGWVIQLTGYHYHNSDMNNPDEFEEEGLAEAGQFVRQTLIKNLREGTVMLPSSKNGELKEYTMEQLGIRVPVMISNYRPSPVTYDPNAASTEEAESKWSQYRQAAMGDVGGGGFGRPTAAAKSNEPAPTPPEHWKLRKYEFEVQFIWYPTTRTDRDDGKIAGSGDSASDSASDY